MHMLAWGGVSILFFLVMLVLEVMFISLKNYLFIALLICGVALGIGFIPGLTQTSLMVSVAAIVLIVWSGYAAKIAFDDSLKIRFFHIANNALKGGILAIALIAGLLFFNIFSINPVDSSNMLIPQGVFDSTAAIFSKTLGSALGGIDFSLTLRQSATIVLDKQISQDQTLSANLTPALREQIINKAIEDYQSRLSGILGQQINPDVRLSTALYGALLTKINSLPPTTRSLVILGGAIILLFSVAAVSPLIRPIIALVAFIFYEILLAVGFGDIVYENRSKETIVLP